MKKPVEPKPEDCCNSGCNPCIFDIYEKQLQMYKTQIESGLTSCLVKNAIHQLEYTKFYVLKNIDLKNEHRLVLFKLGGETSENRLVTWSPGDHFLLKYSSDNKNCTRAYTPIKIKLDLDDYDFAVLVKRYNSGLVSNYMCDLNIGDSTLWRGPYGNYKLDPHFSRLIMIAQGTGIAPLYSIIQQVLNNENDMTKIVLFFCCRDDRSILLRDELYFFRSFWNFNYEVFLSHTQQELSCKYQEPLTNHRLNTKDVIKQKPFFGNDQFLICGSCDFMKYYKQWLNEQENIEEKCIVTF